MSDAADRPLAGIRVLDLSWLLPGPMATLQLSDMGADVIKIEPPGAGDPARAIGPGVDRETPSLFFRMINRGKQLDRLDLKDFAQREQFLRMVGQADIVVESFRPGVMARLGIDWAVLRERNPALVLCSISGYGQTGPMAALAGHDINYLAAAGVLQQIADGDDRPVLPNLQIADLLGGAQTALQGLLAALVAVKMGGSGRHVDISMTHASFANNVMPLVAVKQGGVPGVPGHDLLTGGAPCYRTYRTGDNRFIALGALELKFWEVFCGVLGRPELATRHWACGQVVGGTEAKAVIAILEREFALHDLAYWVDQFAGSDCCVTPVLRSDEALKLWTRCDTPDAAIGCAVRFMF